MRIARLFALSMLSITALAIVLGAEVLVSQTRTFISKCEAIKSVEAFGAILTVNQQVTALRAPYVGPLFQDTAATSAQLETIARAWKSVDAALAQAKAAINALDDGDTFVEGLDRAAARLADVRAATDGTLIVPMSGRDPSLVNGFLPEIAGIVAIIDPLLNRAANRTATADSSLTTLLNVARTAQDLRIAAGSRGATMSLPLSIRRPLTAAEISAIDRGQGRLELDREQIEAGVDQLGAPTQLAQALKGATESYFGHAALVIEKQLSAGRSDGNYSISHDELANTIVPAVQSFFGLRDAALSEAAGRADAARHGALMMLVIAIVIVATLFVVLLGATIMLQRRVVAPLVILTNVVDKLATGEHEVMVPNSGRADEIGTMARSLEVFKKALIAKKAADEAAEAEANAKIQRGQRVDKLTRDFETTIEEIVKVVSSASTDLEDSASTLTGTAERSVILATAVSAASEEASSNVQSVAAATEEMASSVDEISRQVQASAHIASEAVGQARRTNDRIGQLAEAASRIGDVIELINSVAGQTNLLALNATIEAARAGDAGRGFAVVASEVKVLAEQTAKATGEIGQQISGIQAATDESVVSIREIGDTITKMAEISSAIASAVEEQGAATREISRNVQQAARGTQQVSSNISDVQRGAGATGSASAQVLAAAKSLSTESNRLKVTVDRFLDAVRVA